MRSRPLYRRYYEVEHFHAKHIAFPQQIAGQTLDITQKIARCFRRVIYLCLVYQREGLLLLCNHGHELAIFEACRLIPTAHPASRNSFVPGPDARPPATASTLASRGGCGNPSGLKRRHFSPPVMLARYDLAHIAVHGPWSSVHGPSPRPRRPPSRLSNQKASGPGPSPGLLCRHAAVP